MDYETSNPKEYPGVTRTLSAKLTMPGTNDPSTCISAKDFLHTLLAFNAKIAEMILALDTKGDKDKIGLEFDFEFQPKGSTHAELYNGIDVGGEVIPADGQNLSRFVLRCYCNGSG